MENNRGQSIFLSVVGIATLLVAIVGATFAYFSINVTGNDTASSIIVTTANVKGVTFNGEGAGIEVTNAYPGYSKTKTFTIAVDAGVDGTIEYQIVLHTTTATLSAAATTGEFTYTLAGTGTGAAGTPNAVTGDMPGTIGDTVIATGTVSSAASHSYNFTVELVERSVPQDNLQGLTYQGIIQIVIATNQGLRTWDESVSNWKPYGTANSGQA